MPADDRLQVVRDCYRAYEAGDRDLVERILTDDFTFSAPPDVGIDRATYFERCWPASQTTESFEFKRLVEVNGEVFVGWRRRARWGVSGLRLGEVGYAAVERQH